MSTSITHCYTLTCVHALCIDEFWQVHKQAEFIAHQQALQAQADANFTSLKKSPARRSMGDSQPPGMVPAGMRDVTNSRGNSDTSSLAGEIKGGRNICKKAFSSSHILCMRSQHTPAGVTASSAHVLRFGVRDSSTPL